MKKDDISLFCQSETSAFRLNIAAELILGPRCKKAGMSRVASDIRARCSDYIDIRERALVECLVVLEAEPRNCLAHYIAGHAYAGCAEASSSDSKIELLSRAAAHYEQALACIKDGQEHKALIFLPADKRHDESLGLDTKIKLGLAELYAEAGLVLMGTGRWPEAVTCYKKVTEYDPLRTTGWIWLAKALFKSEGVDRAIEVLEYAQSVDKQHENFDPALGSYLKKYTDIAALRDEFLRVGKV